MDDDTPDPPALRREVVLPPDSVDVHAIRKGRQATNHQVIRWKRLPRKGRFRGVCAGLAYRFGWSPWKVRLAFIIGTLLLAGLPVAFYLHAIAFVPARKRLPKDFDEKTGSEDSD